MTYRFEYQPNEEFVTIHLSVRGIGKVRGEH
jgi:hypothetical protein